MSAREDVGDSSPVSPFPYFQLWESPIVMTLAMLPVLVVLFARRRRPAVLATETLVPAPAGPSLRVDELPAAMAAVREHARDDQLYHAGALYARVRETQRQAGLPVDSLILEGLSSVELERRYSVLQAALAKLNSDSGWRELSSNATSRTCVHHGSDGSVWAKTEAELPLRAHQVVSVLRETDLFRTWYPRCVESTTLHTVGRLAFQPVYAL